MPVKQKTYIIDDIYALPDGERAELIDRQIYYMAMIWSMKRSRHFITLRNVFR